MNLWGQFAPPLHAWLPLGLAALAPGVLAIVVLISRWRGRSLATALTLRTLLVLAVGFAILAAVSTVAVVQTGLRELRQRHTSDLRALADGIGTTPLGLNGADAQRRLASFRVKDPSVEFAAASIDGCQSTCVLSFDESTLPPGLLREGITSAWTSDPSAERTLTVGDRPFVLLAMPVTKSRGSRRPVVLVGISAQYLADQAARTAWLLLAISHTLLVIVGWTSWKQVSRSLATRIHRMNEQLRSGVADESTHENLGVDGYELRELADSVSAYIKRTLDEKSSSEERHRRLAELSPDAVLMCVDRVIRSANPAAIALSGATSRSELVASSIDRFVEFDEDDPAERPALRPATWRRLDGRTLHVEVAEVADTGAGEAVRQFVVRDITTRKQREADLAHRAEHDSLTGLVNRARFEAHLNDMLTPNAALANKHGKAGEVAVIFIDLDGFKPVNDTYGHAAGDAVLVAVATRLRDSTRGSDLVARLGGDEFAVLLEVRDPAEVIAVAERILRALHQPIMHERALLVIGASLGIATSRLEGEAGAPSRDATELVRAADDAMYAAKSDGKDRYVVAAVSGQSTDPETGVRFPAVA